MKQIPVLQLGAGAVGTALIKLIAQGNEWWGGREGFMFHYRALLDSTSMQVGQPMLAEADLRAGLQHKAAHGRLPQAADAGIWLALLAGLAPSIVVDLSDSDGTAPFLLDAVQRGHSVVLANNRPLLDDPVTFRLLTADGRTRYEATVCAGMPLVSILQTLIDTRDTVAEVSGCWSELLNLGLGALEQGQSFAQMIGQAHEQGLSELRIWEELQGLAAARTLLILARTLGSDQRMPAIQRQPLLLAELEPLSPGALLAALPRLDAQLAERLSRLRPEGKTLRYLACTGPGRPQVGLAEVPRESPFGQLQGRETLVSIRSARNGERPLLFQRQAAGAEQVAAAVLADMLALAREQERPWRQARRAAWISREA